MDIEGTAGGEKCDENNNKWSDAAENIRPGK